MTGNEQLAVQLLWYVTPTGKGITPSILCDVAPQSSLVISEDGQPIVAAFAGLRVDTGLKSRIVCSNLSSFDDGGDLAFCVAAEGAPQIADNRNPAPRRHAAPARPARDPEASAAYRPDAVGPAIAKILSASAANAGKNHLEQRPGFLSALGEVALGAARDALIELAIQDVFPGLSAPEVRAIARFASLFLDGELTVAKFALATVKDEFIELLKQEDPRLGASAQVADFLWQLHKAARK